MRWPALSFTLGKTQYGSDWLHKRELDVCKVSHSEFNTYTVFIQLESCFNFVDQSAIILTRWVAPIYTCNWN